jgi:hypothetical protein
VQTETLVVVQPGGHWIDVTVRGSDIAKIRERNDAIAQARPNGHEPGDFRPLNRFRRRYKDYYVTDVETGERIELIISREALDASKARMSMAMRTALQESYSEDMAEAE